jgi:hypothetical protein
MQSEIVESVQHAVTPHECVDMYYPGKENSEGQCFPTTIENRFYVGLPSLGSGGSSTIIFNPDQGLSDIVLTAQLPLWDGASSQYLGWSLGTGWLYNMIDTIALRVGGSSLYYFTSDQLLIDTLTDCEDSGKKDAVFQLGGAPLVQQSDFQSLANVTAYAYIKMPFNSISALQKTLPLPTDLLTQPVQIIITWKRFSSVFYSNNSGLPANLPSGFASAQVNFRQTHMQDTSHLLARREDMNSKALTYPLRYFPQTTFRTSVTSDGSTPVQVNLTGFRAGSLKYIDLWAVAAGDVSSGNWFNLAPITSAVLSVNGLIYYNAVQSGGQLWSICDRRTPAVVSSVTMSAGAVAVKTPTASQWLVVPFGQVDQPQAFENELALGLPIMNSVVNLSIVLPAGTYQLSAAYHYAAALMFSRGSAEYVF